MARTHLLIAFCLFPDVIALQTSANQNDTPYSFVSKNKLFCAQASDSIAIDALKHFKSMPRGKLFDGTMLNLRKSCSDLGYNKSAGEDPCYPGLHTFYRNKEEGEHYYRKLQKHLKEFAESQNVTLEDANFMDACKCHEKSYAKTNINLWYSKSCDGKSLFSIGTNPQRSFTSKDKLFCAQAPKYIASDALRMFKSMPRGKLYDGADLNKNMSCEDMGYTSSAGEDPCYPGLKTFYRNKEEGEQFYRDLQTQLKEFGEHKHATLDDINFVEACKCHKKSYARSNIATWYNKSCDDTKHLLNDRPHSFVSKNKFFCAQATQSIVSGALNLFKSMPRGKLFDGTMLNLRKSCSDLGYKKSAGEDPCYPGLHTFYRNKEEGENYFKELQNHLKEFAESQNVTLDDANFMDTCKCHEKSYAQSNIKLWFKKSCDNSQ